MEAGDGAAGDGGEQDGEDGLGDAGSILAVTDHGQANTGGIGHVGMGNDDAQGSDGQHGVQQEGGQIVTGLQQDPHGSHGSHSDVDTDDPHPGLAGQVDGVEVHADGDDGDDGQNADDGSGAHGDIPAVHGKAKDDSDDDEQQGNHSHTGIGQRSGLVQNALIEGGAEGAGHDGGEGSHDQDQGQVGEDQEQPLGAGAHVGGDDFADGLTAVTDGSEQGAEIVDTAEEDTADHDPQRAGAPAEAGSSGADGAGNGAGTGDGGEVVTHQNRSLGGHIVNAVLHGVGRGGLIVFTYAPLFAQVTAIEDIANHQSGAADDQKKQTIHTIFLLPSWFSGGQNCSPDFAWLPFRLDWKRSNW